MINDGGSESRLQAWRKKAKGFILSPAWSSSLHLEGLLWHSRWPDSTNF
jgi:hypothetical protein